MRILALIGLAVNKDITELRDALKAGLDELLANGTYAEIVRSGIMSVSSGQTIAALALGMTTTQTMRHIIFPQAMRVIVPPLANEVIAMVKATSPVSVIAYMELLTTVQVI